MSPRAWRNLAERITRRLVIPRRLPAEFGRVRIHVSTEGGLRYLRPRLSMVDPPLLRVVAEVIRPGASVWDIGANIGLFSFAAAAIAGPTGRVLAVEPDIRLVSLLRRSAGHRHRHVAPVDVFPAAVQDRVGVGRLHIARRSRAANHLEGHGTTQTGGTRHIELVPTVTLDWLLEHFPRPDVLKIDVEAAEALVLQGGGEVLNGGPVLICEVAHANAESVSRLLRRSGYRLYDSLRPEHLRRPLDRAPWALLAIPASAVQEYRYPTRGA